MIKGFILFVKLMITQRYLIFSMVKRDLETQYVGSLLGFIWTIVHPMVMVFIYWVVFSVGFKVQPANGVPFVVWLTAGMAAWQVFAEAVSGSAGSITANAHLIKKTVFPSQVLPVVKILLAVATHGIFLLVLVGLLFFQKIPPNVYWLQFLYYLFCSCALALGIGWAVSALNVFVKDVAQIVAVVLQLGFWATPIFWDISMMPAEIQRIVLLNPMFYVVTGYRQSFLYSFPFWHQPWQALYFWVVTLALFLVGGLIFKKLKPHFADVL